MQSLGTCDHFLETISVLGCQILLSNRKTDSFIRSYVLLQQLFSLQSVFGSVRSTLKKLSFVKRMFPEEKQCLCPKTRIIMTPWRNDVQPCDVQGKSPALKLAPTSKGWLESVLSWAHKSQPRIDVQIHLFYFSGKSISGKPWFDHKAPSHNDYSPTEIHQAKGLSSNGNHTLLSGILWAKCLNDPILSPCMSGKDLFFSRTP